MELLAPISDRRVEPSWAQVLPQVNVSVCTWNSLYSPIVPSKFDFSGRVNGLPPVPSLFCSASLQSQQLHLISLIIDPPLPYSDRPTQSALPG